MSIQTQLRAIEKSICMNIELIKSTIKENEDMLKLREKILKEHPELKTSENTLE
jgi:hypothetical protein